METKTTYEWDFIMCDSDYNISLKLLEVYNNDDYEELGKALQAYHEGSKSSAKYELYKEVSLLMYIILLWKYNNDSRTQENREKINYYRTEISYIFEFNGFLNEKSLDEIWNDAFEDAIDLAETYIEDIGTYAKLTKQEILEKKY